MDEEPRIYNIPLNYKNPGKWRSLLIPNLAEGIIVAVIVEYFLMKIPFTFQFGAIVFILSSAAIIVAFTRGINGERVSLFILLFLRYLIMLISKTYQYHMRKVGVKDVQAFENRNSGNRTRDFAKVIAFFKKEKEKSQKE